MMTHSADGQTPNRVACKRGGPRGQGTRNKSIQATEDKENAWRLSGHSAVAVGAQQRAGDALPGVMVGARQVHASSYDV